MEKIKIISNPYRKETRYQKFLIDSNEWVDIDYSNCKNSFNIEHAIAIVFEDGKAISVGIEDNLM